MRIYITVFFAILFFLAPVVSHGQPKITVATYQYATNNRIENIKPLATHLSTTCGCDAEVKSYETVTTMLQGMSRQESDIVLMNTFGYILFDNKQSNYKPVVALKVADGKTSTYQSVIIAKKSLGISQLTELTKRASSLSLLLVNLGSTSGNLVPRLGLASVGINDADQAFKSISYSKNHALTLREIADGNYDIGAFGSEEYTKALAIDSTLSERVTVLWSSSDIPLGPVMVLNKLPKELSKCIERELLSLHLTNTPALESVKAGWTEAIPADRYIPITNEYYQNWLNQLGGTNAIPIIKKFSN